MICTQSPGHVCVVSNPGVAKQVGEPLGHQDSDLLDGAPQLEDANVETRLGPLSAVPVEGQFLLQQQRETQNAQFSGYTVRPCVTLGCPISRKQITF